MARGHPQIPFVSSEVETPRRRARLTGISTSLDANEKKTKASGRPPAEPFFQRNHLPGRADRLHLAAGQKRQHRRIANIDMRQRALALGRPRDDRSEEHTSELQSLMRISYAAFCLKKNNTTNTNH